MLKEAVGEVAGGRKRKGGSTSVEQRASFIFPRTDGDPKAPIPLQERRLRGEISYRFSTRIAPEHEYDSHRMV